MKLTDKYEPTTINPEVKTKLSDDAYAIIEALELLTLETRRLGVQR